MEPTRPEIEKYVESLDGVVQRLYRQVEVAYLLTAHDTLSDEFQICASIRDVFAARTAAQLCRNPIPSP